MLVLVYHVIRLSSWAGAPDADIPFVLRNGWVGVDLFLVISGFVITLTALKAVDKQDAAFRPAFARRRLARIVPLYFLTCLLFLALVNPGLLYVESSKLWVHIVTHILFVHNLVAETHGSINGPAWSVALEMQFYLLVFLLAPRLARVSPLRLLLVTLAVAMAWRFMVVLVWPPATTAPIITFIYTTQLPGVIDQFGMGIAMALLVHRGGTWWARRLETNWRNFAFWMAIAACLLLVASVLHARRAYLLSAPMIVAWRPIMAAGFAAMLGAAITFPAASARVLAPIRYLGDISYGIYLWHMLVLFAVARNAPGIQGFELLTYVVVTTLLLAAMSWHWLEKPFLQRYRGA